MKGLRAVAVMVLCTVTVGCATYSTISEAERGSAKFFSGTRLDMRAISGHETSTTKFTVDPPTYPLVDLPFSFTLDLVLSPLTFSAIIYESIFE